MEIESKANLNYVSDINMYCHNPAVFQWGLVKTEPPGIHVFEPFLKCVFVTRDTRFWRKNCILFVFYYNLCNQKHGWLLCSNVHMKRIVLIRRHKLCLRSY